MKTDFLPSFKLLSLPEQLWQELLKFNQYLIIEFVQLTLIKKKKQEANMQSLEKAGYSMDFFFYLRMILCHFKVDLLI